MSRVISTQPLALNLRSERRGQRLNDPVYLNKPKIIQITSGSWSVQCEMNRNSRRDFIKDDQMLIWLSFHEMPLKEIMTGAITVFYSRI
ncbi:MAG: hypothetical protein U0T81_04265 [Saprospiraceae bacterium]